MVVLEEGKVLGLDPIRLRALVPTPKRLNIKEIELYPPLQKTSSHKYSLSFVVVLSKNICF